jgi:ribosomal protein L29
MGNSRFLYFICAICIIIATVSTTMLIQQQDKPPIKQNTQPKIEYASSQEKEDLENELSTLSNNLPNAKTSYKSGGCETSSNISRERRAIVSKIDKIKMKLQTYNYNYNYNYNDKYSVTKKELKEMKDEVKEIKQDIRYFTLRVDQFNSTY